MFWLIYNLVTAIKKMQIKHPQQLSLHEFNSPVLTSCILVTLNFGKNAGENKHLFCYLKREMES